MHKSGSIDSIHSEQAAATVSDDGEETFNFKSKKQASIEYEHFSSAFQERSDVINLASP